MEAVDDNKEILSDGVERTYTSFLIAGVRFAVDVRSVKEIVKTKKLIPLTEPFEDVEGFIELHSVRIPVLNTKKILKLNSSSADEGVMIVNIEGFIFGLMVDVEAEMEIFSFITKPKSLTGNEPYIDFVEGRLSVDEKSINILSLAALLSKKSKERLFAAR